MHSSFETERLIGNLKQTLKQALYVLMSLQNLVQLSPRSPRTSPNKIVPEKSGPGKLVQSSITQLPIVRLR